MRYFDYENPNDWAGYPYDEDEEWDRQELLNELRNERDRTQESIQIQREADYRSGWLPYKKLS